MDLYITTKWTRVEYFLNVINGREWHYLYIHAFLFVFKMDTNLRFVKLSKKVEAWKDTKAIVNVASCHVVYLLLESAFLMKQLFFSIEQLIFIIIISKFIIWLYDYIDTSAVY